MSYSRHYDIEPSGRRRLQPTTLARTFAQLYREGNILPSAAVVDRRCFDAVGLFNPNLKRFEDKELWLRLTQRFSFEGLEESLVLRRLGPWQRNDRILHYRELRKVFESTPPPIRLRSPRAEHGTRCEAGRRQQIAKYSYLLGRTHQRAGQFQEAARELTRALRTNPLVGFHTRHAVRDPLVWPRAAMDPWVRLALCLYQEYASRANGYAVSKDAA